MPNPKVVILCLENRSFDEYFGTFPGAIGFYDPDAGDVFSQPGLTSDGSDLQPFRMSSFSTSSQWSPPMNHSWWPFVQEWNYGAMNGFSTQAPAADSAVTLPDGTGYASGACVMGYYAANDIAYRWSLAQSFLRHLLHLPDGGHRAEPDDADVRHGDRSEPVRAAAAPVADLRHGSG
jgi:phospholipase C